MDELKLSQEFITAVREASLDNDKLPEEVIHRLRHPRQNSFDLDDEPELKTAIEFFMDTTTASEEVFNKVRDTHHRSLDRLGVEYEPLPSLYETKKKIEEITGVYSMKHDMCINTCMAYTGPFKDYRECFKCSAPRFDPQIYALTSKEVPQRQFDTIPLGPQLQALWSSVEGATSLRYRSQKTAEVLNKGRENDGQLDEWDDIFCGSEYLEAVNDGRIKDGDTVILLSIDGAQLYESKQSDCWIYIWVILDLAPDKRYRKRHILPGGFIPGPNKPKNVDSFLFPGLITSMH